MNGQNWLSINLEKTKFILFHRSLKNRKYLKNAQLKIYSKCIEVEHIIKLHITLTVWHS